MARALETVSQDVIHAAITDLIGDNVTFTYHDYYGTGAVLTKVENGERWLIRPNGERIELPKLILKHSRRRRHF